MTEIGPVQLLAIGFGPEASYEGQIVDEVARLEGGGQIRVLDMLFVGQDAEGEDLLALEYQGDELGALVGALLGFVFEEEGVEPVVVTAPAPGTDVGAMGLTRGDLERLIRSTPPDEAVALLLIEHVWAKPLQRAIREAGGTPLAAGFLSQEALGAMGAELTEIVRTIEQIEREEHAAVGGGGAARSQVEVPLIG